MTTVTLLMFSGRPDPTWDLAAGKVKALARRLQHVESAPELSTLGYRGFLVESDDPGMPSKVIVRDSPQLELFLLRTGKTRLAPEITSLVEETIK
jgi:hypothetical protein